MGKSSKTVSVQFLIFFVAVYVVYRERSCAATFYRKSLTSIDVLPVISYALESPTHSLVDAALRTLPVVLPILDFPTIKNELFPIIANVFAKTSSMGIKIRGLEAFRTLCGGGGEDADQFQRDDLTGVVDVPKAKNSNVSILDKYTIQEKVVPLLKGIKTKEPAVMVSTTKYAMPRP
jgi:SCY1-like protein 2